MSDAPNPVALANWSADAWHDFSHYEPQDDCAICYWRPRLATLAANLHTAAFGQAMFDAGELHGEFSYVSDNGAETRGIRIPWRPGCHRTAPGWAHGEGEK